MDSQRMGYVFIMAFLLINVVNANPIQSEYIIELDGTCTQSCRDALQLALDADSDTVGCSLASTGTKIGPLSFEYVECPIASNVAEAVVSGVVFAQSGNAPVPTVQLVSQDQEMNTQATPTSLWGIDETDGGVNRNLLLQPVRDGLRTCSMGSNNGAGVNVWIFDTGCSPTNGGLCEGYHGGTNVCQDNNGHGAHVAGTATDNVFGVAFEAARSCIKVLSDGGGGRFSDVIRALEYVSNNLNLFGNGDVVNMSLGGGRQESVNSAIRAARDLGVFFALAAGNDNQNACDFSPASADGTSIFTVQAHTEGLKKALFSNYATLARTCTTLSAPGVNIESIGGFKSGTSMAAPHVAGACAVLLSDNETPTKAKLTARSVAINPLLRLKRRTLGLDC